MGGPDARDVSATPLEPLIGRAATLGEAAETMLLASRTMLAAASSASGSSPGGMRERELMVEAVEEGFLRALRRDTVLGEGAGAETGASALGLPWSRGIPGAGYGRMGASITGQGARAQLYGTIGGAIGYAVGGPIGAVLGGMLGGWLGGDDDDEEARRQEQLRRQWLNTPEGFEIQAYLYQLSRALGPGYWAAQFPPVQRAQTATPRLPYSGVVVNVLPGSVQIMGSGEAAGEQAARAFAGSLGRVLQLNRVVVPGAGLGGEV